MIQATILLCSTLMVISSMLVAVFLLADKPLVQVTVQVAPVTPNVILRQSAGQVFTGNMRAAR